MVKILDPISAQSVAFIADTGSVQEQAHLVHFENDARIRLRPTERVSEEEQNRLRKMIGRSAAVYVYDMNQSLLVDEAAYDACREELPRVMIATTRLLTTGRPTVVHLSK